MVILFIGLAISACGKTDLSKVDSATSNTVKNGVPASALAKSEDDVALECSFASPQDGTGPSKILIYSPNNSVRKFGQEKANGEWDPEYRIDSKSSDNVEVIFDLTSYSYMLAKRLNPEVEKSREVLRINRSTLDASLEINSKFVGFIRMNFKCYLLSPAKFERHVKWLEENNKILESKNRI